MFSFGGGEKKTSAKKREQLEALGLDTSLFEDPTENMLDLGPTPDELPPMEEVDVSAFVTDGDEDVHVELTEDDLLEGSMLSRELESMASLLGDGTAEQTVEQKIANLEALIAEEKQTATFLHDNGMLEEAKEYLPKIGKLVAELKALKQQLSTTTTKMNTVQSQQPAPTVILPTQQIDSTYQSVSSSLYNNIPGVTTSSMYPSMYPSPVPIAETVSSVYPSFPSFTATPEVATPTPNHGVDSLSESFSAINVEDNNLLLDFANEMGIRGSALNLTPSQTILPHIQESEKHEGDEEEEREGQKQEDDDEFVAPDPIQTILQPNISSSTSSSIHSHSESQITHESTMITKQGHHTHTLSSQSQPDTIIEHVPVLFDEEDLEDEFSQLDNADLRLKSMECVRLEQECMKNVLYYKNLGSKPDAMAWFRSVKNFQAAQKLLDAGQNIDIELYYKALANNPQPEGYVLPSLAIPLSSAPTTNIPKVPTPSAIITSSEAEKRETQMETRKVLVEQAETVAEIAARKLLLEQAEQARLAQFTLLIQKLTEQMERWRKIGMECKEKEEKGLAVKYLRECKQMQEDIKKVNEWKALPGVPLPTYTLQPYVHQSEIHFKDKLATNELEVVIIQAKNIKPPAGMLTVDSYVTMICPFTEDPTQATLSTRKISGTNSPEYKDGWKIKIDRTKKSFVKLLERKKISFELFHSRFLRSHISLGKCELSLNDIKTKAEIRATIPILTGRRETGGELLVRVRICYPLLAKHLVEEQDSMIVFTQDLNNPPPPVQLAQIQLIAQPSRTPTTTTNQPQPRPSSQTTTAPTARPAVNQPQPTAPSQPIQQTKPPAQATPVVAQSQPKPATASPAPAAAQAQPKPAQVQAQVQVQPKPAQVQAPTVQTQTPKPTQAPTATANVHSNSAPVHLEQPTEALTPEEEEDLYNPVSGMCSNDVLEWALESVTKKIEMCKQKRQEVPDELITRQSQIEAQLQVLVLQVQSEVLSMEDYVAMVEKKITQEKELAAQYMSKQNKTAAKYALMRARIMTKELEDA